jgi:hypothetical protein
MKLKSQKKHYDKRRDGEVIQNTRLWRLLPRHSSSLGGVADLRGTDVVRRGNPCGVGVTRRSGIYPARGAGKIWPGDVVLWSVSRGGGELSTRKNLRRDRGSARVFTSVKRK